MVFLRQRRKTNTKRTPSFKGLVPASETSSRIKKNNRRTDTKHELLLRSSLWKHGLRFRKNVSDLPGKPDIVFTKAKIVVFCDGDFWHGRNWAVLKKKLSSGTNAPYWSEKIKTNMERDKRNSAKLRELGWTVVRLWESDITKNLTNIADEISELVRGRL